MIALTRKGAGALPGEYFLHLLAASGSGTNADAWDGNSAMAAAKNTIGAKGGKIKVAVGAFRVTQPVNLTEACIQLEGVVAGFPKDPNASVRGDRGTRFFVQGTFVQIGVGGPSDRLGNMGAAEIYCHGDDMNNTASVCYDIVGCIDQGKFTRNVISGFYKAYNMSTAKGGSNIDTVYFDNENVLYCFHAFYDDNNLLECFPQFRGGCFSDTPGYGFYFARNRAQGSIARSIVIDGVTLVRNNYSGQYASVHYAGNRLRLVNCSIEDTGLNLLTGSYAANANAVIINGDYNYIGGNAICGTVTGNAVTISGYNNTIESNILWGGNGLNENGNSRITTGISTNKMDYVINADAYDTTINQAGTFRFIDNGVRTLINNKGKNAGDPRSAGQWNGHAKPEGCRIYDYVNAKFYEFSVDFQDGVRIYDANVTAGSGGGSNVDPDDALPKDANGNTQNLPARNASVVNATSPVESTDTRLGRTVGFTRVINPIFAGGSALCTYDDNARIYLSISGSRAYQMNQYYPSLPDFGILQYSIDNGSNWVDVSQNSPTVVASFERPAVMFNQGSYYVIFRKKPGQDAGVQVCWDHADVVLNP